MQSLDLFARLYREGQSLSDLPKRLNEWLNNLVQMWDLSSTTLLTTFYFPRPITLLAWDVTERLFFAGSADGDIHQVNLFKRPKGVQHSVLEAVGGGGSTDVVRITEEDEEREKQRLIFVGYVTPPPPPTAHNLTDD